MPSIGSQIAACITSNEHLLRGCMWLLGGADDPMDACMRQAWWSSGVDESDDLEVLLIPPVFSGTALAPAERRLIFLSLLCLPRSVRVWGCRRPGEADREHSQIDRSQRFHPLYGAGDKGTKTSIELVLVPLMRPRALRKRWTWTFIRGPPPWHYFD
jgi:hypothetical protein